jgi:hypothetical protein
MRNFFVRDSNSEVRAVLGMEKKKLRKGQMREGFKCREPCSCFDTFIWGCIRRKMNRVDSKCEYNSKVF